MLTKYDGIRIVHHLCQAFGPEAEYRNGYLVAKAPLSRLEYSPRYHWELAELGKEEEYLSLPYPEVEELLSLYKEVKGTEKKVAVPSWVSQPFVSKDDWLKLCILKTKGDGSPSFRQAVYNLYIQAVRIVDGTLDEGDFLFLASINFYASHRSVLRTIWERRQVQILGEPHLTTDPILLMMAVSD